MANRLKMAHQKAIQVLYEKGWSQRRIARELGVNRETVGRYVRLRERLCEEEEASAEGDSKPAISIAGSKESPPAVWPGGGFKTSHFDTRVRPAKTSHFDHRLDRPPEPVRTLAGNDCRGIATGPFSTTNLAGPANRTRLRGQLSIGPTLHTTTASHHPASFPPPGVRSGTGSADRLRHWSHG